MFLQDEYLYLRALSRKDVDGNYGCWFNDPEVTKYNSHGKYIMTSEKLIKYIENSQNDNSMLVFAIIIKNTDAHVGNISLQNINWIDRRAEIAFILGEKENHGKGVMFRAGQLLIEHAFNELNLHRVYCGTLATNLGMKKLAIKLGMTEEGVRKEVVYKSGRYIDVVEYGLINELN